MPRRMLITGATGGLGLALVQAARADGHTVLATGRSSAAEGRIAMIGAAFHPADLTASNADLRALCRGCHSVIHAAALSASWGPRQAFERINVGATEALLEAARAEGCSRFVFVSSPSIFADFRDRLGLRSADAPRDPPLNDYAVTKLAAEQRVLAANGPSMSTTAVRPRAITGPDDRVLLPRLAALLARPSIPLIGGGRALIELTDVRDAARAILAAEDNIATIAGAAINVSGGRAMSVAEIAAALADALQRRPRTIDVPLAIARPLAAILESGARLAGASEPRLTRYTLATLGYSQTFDMEETARLIGFRPAFDGLAALIHAARMCGS